MLGKGNELLIGGYNGWLEVFNIISGTITHSQKIRAQTTIYDIVAIDETHLLLASSDGILKSTKD